MTTARTICTEALQELGVIENGAVPDGDDFVVCLNALNTLADAWLLEPNYAYTKNFVSAALPAATTSRTIGAGMQFNCPRPVRLEDPGCYITVGTLDYPLDVISQADYAAIVLKGTTGPWPSVCMYDGESPTGTVYFWPLGACTVNLFVEQQVSQWATLATDVTLTPGYHRAFKFALMEEVAGVFSKQLTPIQLRHAANARRMVKRANFVQPQMVIGNPNPPDTQVTRIKAG